MEGWLSAGWPDKYSSSYQVQICASQDVSGWLRQGITWSTQCTWDVRAREITVWQIYKHLPKREQSLTSIRRSRVDFRRRTPLAEGGGIDEFCSWVKCNTTYKRFILVFSIVMCADKVTLVWGACFYITKKKKEYKINSIYVVLLNGFKFHERTLMAINYIRK